MHEKKTWILLRNFVIELIVYGALVAVYSIVVLRLLGEPLVRLLRDNLAAYALVGLGLIATQGVLLDLITSFLLDWLRLGRLE
ncbi:MAG: hypothetical protein ACE5OS_03650 [Anaerolineae bacterium]